ncbi:DUF4232 domain-containing protein [Kitasatospora sp. NPDC059722]|uniref:DUF4232 domain-containing protein n=1 Tax=Kitasatospora sp. NPDC059722 TaxID=3346925 RepID=UPI0036750A82
MSVRTSRTRPITVAATVVVAALSLAACNDNGDIATSTGPSLRATAPASPAAPTSVGAAGKTPAAVPKTPAPMTSAPAAPAAPAAPSAPAAPTTCQAANTKTVAAPLNRPVNHLLLTVTNTGPVTCYLDGYPAVRFGEDQSVPPVIAESKPQAVVTLKPGESGYASVDLSSTDGTNGSNGRTATSLVVYFRGPSGSGSVGAGAHPSLPEKGVYVDDSLKVTYWQQSLDDATSW